MGTSEVLNQRPLTSNWSTNLSQERGVHSDDVTYPECPEELTCIIIPAMDVGFIWFCVA